MLDNKDIYISIISGSFYFYNSTDKVNYQFINGNKIVEISDISFIEKNLLKKLDSYFFNEQEKRVLIDFFGREESEKFLAEKTYRPLYVFRFSKSKNHIKYGINYQKDIEDFLTYNSINKNFRSVYIHKENTLIEINEYGNINKRTLHYHKIPYEEVELFQLSINDKQKRKIEDILSENELLFVNHFTGHFNDGFKRPGVPPSVSFLGREVKSSNVDNLPGYGKTEAIKKINIESDKLLVKEVSKINEKVKITGVELNSLMGI